MYIYTYISIYRNIHIYTYTLVYLTVYIYCLEYNSSPWATGHGFTGGLKILAQNNTLKALSLLLYIPLGICTSIYTSAYILLHI